MVLQRRYDAVFVGSLEELAPLALGSAFDIIVLCHTLSVEERGVCVALAGDLWPAAKFVTVVARSGDRRPELGAVVVGLEGPQALLNIVQRLLEPALSTLGPS